MEMVNEKLKVLRSKLDKYPAAEDAEVGHHCPRGSARSWKGFSCRQPGIAMRYPNLFLDQHIGIKCKKKNQ